ncbi:SAV_915 family protein [Streptomyces narbonensis]
MTRLFRTPVGGRTAVAFTGPERLRAVLGAAQPWVVLAEPALRALVEPLGVRELRIDPVLTARTPGATPTPTPSATPAATIDGTPADTALGVTCSAAESVSGPESGPESGPDARPESVPTPWPLARLAS